jgi:hypothetical protein
MVNKEKMIPDFLKGRQQLSKYEFGKKYFGDNKVLESMAIEFLEHLEKTYNLNLSGLHPTDRLCDITARLFEKKDDLKESETKTATIRQALISLIEFQPLEKYLKNSNWEKTTIRYRSFASIVREITNCKNK